MKHKYDYSDPVIVSDFNYVPEPTKTFSFCNCEQYQDEITRLNRENLQLKRRLERMKCNENKHKRIISKQNKRLQKYEDKPQYININKGPKKKRRKGNGSPKI